jgi:hypothetical protein
VTNFRIVALSGCRRGLRSAQTAHASWIAVGEIAETAASRAPLPVESSRPESPSDAPPVGQYVGRAVRVVASNEPLDGGQQLGPRTASRAFPGPLRPDPRYEPRLRAWRHPLHSRVPY